MTFEPILDTPGVLIGVPDFGDVVRDLYQSQAYLADVYERLRIILADIAGCSLAEWNYDDLDRYCNLALRSRQC